MASIAMGGMGLLFAGKKREWLYRRFVTERLRQFHFQAFALLLPEIISSQQTAEDKAKFLSVRNAALDQLKERYDSRLDSEFADIVDHDNATQIRLLDEHKDGRHVDMDAAEPLFAAYRELRIEHQIGYANHKLKKTDHKIFSGDPHRQSVVISAFAFICLVLFCGIHAGILIGILGSATHVLDQCSFWAWFRSPTANMFVIWIAILALAMRAIEQGLQPERELERYEHYRSALQAILERFEAARSVAEKVRTMRELERLAFDEMRSFLFIHQNARFVM